MMVLAAEPVRGSQETYTIDATTAVDRPMRRILAIPTVWWIIASGATVNFAAYAMTTFLPTMLIRYHALICWEGRIDCRDRSWRHGNRRPSCRRLAGRLPSQEIRSRSIDDGIDQHASRSTAFVFRT